MIAPETFVGSLSILLAIGIAVTALTGHSITTRSQAIQRLRQRFGDGAAKLCLILIALVLLIAGWMILQDLRPSYATTPAGPNLNQDDSSGMR